MDIPAESNASNSLSWHRAYRSTRDFLLLVIFILGPMLLGGCVYLRYLQVKRQLAEPERYLALGKQSGLTLSFREPVLHPGDVLHVAKHHPSKRIEGREETQ